ncbi:MULTISPECIES: integrase arm-type DNA-binding domain-containing protein [unclassified Caballeronia]|uniref:tyrosine-type recombinase/integrase n=1 Tax=unclassified Caballeronia TaxID=2646786 RepID=UPI0020284D38|nr:MULTISPECIES: integrase arm-type DNA-binding domain-containing protein [unclassified Caballeronia]
MPRIAQELGALAVSRLSEPGTHAVGRVAGLMLQISASGARSWILRTTIAGRRREIGLGPYPAVSLKDAHAKAQALRDDIANGVDPLVAKAEAASRLRASRALDVTFKEAATRFIEAKAPEWKSAKHASQWTNTIEEYAYPKIGDLLVRHIMRSHVTDVLEPIWTKKTETASRLRGRIEAILDWARVKGYRDEGMNPAAWRGNLDKLLSAPKKTRRVRNHPALPLADTPAFVADLRKSTGIGSRCLEFVILTAARSGEARGALWTEVDLDRRIWAIPGERMKAQKEHRVPLSDRAVELLKSIERDDKTDLIFRAPRSNKVLSDMTLLAILRKKGLTATPHGFRSTFRDWASEHTNHPRELAEVALAHVPGGASEMAYWRGDILEKRRRLMADWAEFCSSAATSDDSSSD